MVARQCHRHHGGDVQRTIVGHHRPLLGGPDGRGVFLLDVGALNAEGFSRLVVVSDLGLAVRRPYAFVKGRFAAAS